MSSYLTTLGLVVVPLMTGVGLLKMGLFLLKKANIEAAIFGKRAFYATSVVSALYLTSTNWKQVLEDIQKNPLQGIITHLDTAIALAFTLSGAFVGMGKAIDLLNKSNAFGCPEIFNNISTNVWLNLLFFAVFVTFALSFFGLFETKSDGQLN